jgi:tRNA-2-methylthio-N6-dimethylallyladenosine synthase
MSPRVVAAVKAHPALCELFHIPFQSGDDEILKLMRRGYTRASYLNIVQRIRQEFGDEASITADVIVGFPGETEDQFQRTLELLEEVRFDACMTAAYSPRPNTEAALWANQVDEATKQDRLRRAQSMVPRPSTR